MAGEKQINIGKNLIILLTIGLIIASVGFWLFLNKDFLFKRFLKKESEEPLKEIHISFEIFKNQFLREAKTFEKIFAPSEKGRENPIIFY